MKLLWENDFFSLTTGMKFHNGNEVNVCPGKVVSVDLLTDRNYVSKSAVFLDFLYLLLTAWANFSSEWYRSFQESRESF